MSNEVCSFYNVGYCKLKNKCSNIHSSEDCANKCKEKTCPKRHRIVCRDREHCIYQRSNSCEFNCEEEMSNKEAQIISQSQENKELRKEITNKNVQI